MAARAVFKSHKRSSNALASNKAELRLNAEGIDAYSPKDMRLAPLEELLGSRTVEGR